MRTTLPPVIIFGTSGHAKVCLDILQLQQFRIAGFIARDRSDVEKEINGITIIGCDEDEDFFDQIQEGKLAYFVAIGENERRASLTEKIVATTGRHPINAIHPDARISRFAKLGTGNFINCGVKINADAIIGNYAIINTSATVDHDCVISDYVQVSPGCNIGGNVTLDRSVFLGLGTVVLPKMTIGGGTVIGAGAVVTKHVPERVVAVGCPARIIKNL